MLDQVPAVEGRKNGRAGNYPPAEEPDAEAKDQVLQPGGAHLSFKHPLGCSGPASCGSFWANIQGG